MAITGDRHHHRPDIRGVTRNLEGGGSLRIGAMISPTSPLTVLESLNHVLASPTFIGTRSWTLGRAADAVPPIVM